MQDTVPDQISCPPKATIVIPTYNRCHVLSRAIESVLDQKLKDFELIVVDDGSTDETKHTVSKYSDPRVQYIARMNGGISSARNTGVFLASGNWITLLDDDDEAQPDWLSTFDDLLADPSVGIACAGAILKRLRDGSTIILFPRQLTSVYENVRGLFMSGTFACRTSLLKEVRGFAEGLTCSHATELAMRLIPACHRRGQSVKAVNKSLVLISREEPHDRPMSSPAQLLKGVTYILQTHAAILKRSPASVSRYLGIAGVAAVRLGLHEDSRKFFLKSLLANPWNVKPYLRYIGSLNRHLARYIWQSADFRSDLP